MKKEYDFSKGKRGPVVQAGQIHSQLTTLQKRLEEAERLLKRWLDVDIPVQVWSTPAEDCYLPIDTQAFLTPPQDSEEEKP